MAGATFVLYRRDLARAREAARRGSLLAHTGAGLVDYADIGAGVPLLSIHGAGGGFDQGLANATGFAGEGFRVIAPSRFGYLRTPIPQGASPAAQADAHAALLATLGVPRAIVVAVSAGARSAVELAVRHPDRVAALVLVVPGLSAANPASDEPSRVHRLAFRATRAGGDFAWWAAGRVAPLALLRLAGVRPALVAAAPRAERDRLMGILKRVEPVSRRLPGLGIDGRQLSLLFKSQRNIPLNALEGNFLRFSGTEAYIAYAESLAAVSYINDSYGLSDIQSILQRLSQGSSTEAALRATIHADYGQLETDLARYLADRYGE